MTRIAIVGAGNLGAFLAAHLAHAGHDPFFCVRRPPGPIRVAGLPGLSLPFYQSCPPAAEIVLLTVKTYDTPSAMSWFPQLCCRGAPIAVIQNGIHHASRVAPHTAIPVLSYVYVESAAGMHHAYAPPREHFTVPAGAASNLFAGLFCNTPLQVRLEPSFHTAAWRKMLHNCVSNPLTALAGRGLEILTEPLYGDWARRILAEGIAIAQADGAALDPSEPAAILRVLRSYPAGTRTSMLQDHERGRPLELDALNGMLVALGARYGLPTPVNQELISRLRPAPVT